MSDMPQASGEREAALLSGLDHAQLKNPMKAFKKRLKLTRLDERLYSSIRNHRGYSDHLPVACVIGN